MASLSIIRYHRHLVTCSHKPWSRFSNRLVHPCILTATPNDLERGGFFQPRCRQGAPRFPMPRGLENPEERKEKGAASFSSSWSAATAWLGHTWMGQLFKNSDFAWWFVINHIIIPVLESSGPSRVAEQQKWIVFQLWRLWVWDQDAQTLPCLPSSSLWFFWQSSAFLGLQLHHPDFCSRKSSHDVLPMSVFLPSSCLFFLK